MLGDLANDLPNGSQYIVGDFRVVVVSSHGLGTGLGRCKLMTLDDDTIADTSRGEMRAVILDRNGPIESPRVGELDPPEAGPDDMLVRVRAASVNPADLKVVTGKDGAAFIHAKRFPMAIGYDFSGVVEKVGANVRARSAGDEVFGFLAYTPSNGQGSFAELVSVKPDAVGIKPSGLTHEQAAVSATAGVTAIQGLRDKGRLEAGQRVLVNGASGGVGSFAVQIAKQLGAEVWGTSSAAKASFVRRLGADEVVDYRKTPLRSLPMKFDLVLDAASMSSFQEVRSLLEDGGAYVTLLPSPSLFVAMLWTLFSSKRCGFVMVKSKAADLDQLAHWLAAGNVRPSIERTYDLSEVTEALAAQQSGRVQGKLAIRVQERSP
jgi:NADPH:quinone reductase-like Zn-dependent oxidoreductase